jgi:ubiquinone/menaquinone biosynthesis C-methylase UbiE
MQTSDQIKEMVKEQYGSIADQSRSVNASGCCGSGCGCSSTDEAIMAEDYSKLEGYVADADLGLGCGIPTEFALIKEGDTVLDLGSGAGNDCFVARSLTGASGTVIGVDFTEKMIKKARANAAKLGYENVEFRHGDIENLPVASQTVDVVVSNCVLNLVPDKTGAISEMHRVIKTGGHFSVSDIVLDGELPEKLRKAAQMYVGCISGAMQKTAYLDLLKRTGFSHIRVQKDKAIDLPASLLQEYLSEAEVNAYCASGQKILSVTVYGEKKAQENEETADKTEADTCCGPQCCAN